MHWTLSTSYFCDFKWSSTDLLHQTPNCCKGFEMPPGSWHWLHPSAPGWSSVVAAWPGHLGRRNFSALTFSRPWRDFLNLAQQGKLMHTHPSLGEEETAKCISESCISTCKNTLIMDPITFRKFKPALTSQGLALCSFQGSAGCKQTSNYMDFFFLKKKHTGTLMSSYKSNRIWI